PHARRPVRRRLCTMPDRSPGEACMAQTLALVTLLVHDYDEALDWFVGRLGFVPVEDRPVPEQGKRWVVIAPPGGRPSCRLLMARASTPDQQALVGRQLGGRVGFFLETDDLARDHARWQAAGVRFLEAPRREPYGEVVVFADCYGNRWDLLQPAPGHARATPPSLDGVRSGYDRWAAVYDHDANPLLALEESTLRAALGAVAGLDLLDLGTGTGRHALWAAGAGARVTALDFSEGMLAQARAKPGADLVRFLAHDLRQPLPFADAGFDRVVSGLVLEHVEALDGFFAEARRVMRAGGRAVVSAMLPAMYMR